MVSCNENTTENTTSIQLCFIKKPIKMGFRDNKYTLMQSLFTSGEGFQDRLY